ncbi:MAG: M23 family metallopeptidase [Acidobacteria bacterium]|nr:M23 family metallopeptidase [Acidobacteriota bacterium]MCW5971005.1 M23 family metallopeptidase [Blastocatellales bacterium]
MQEKRFYTFVFAPTASSRFRQINLHYRTIYLILGLAVVGMITVSVGAYQLTRHAILVAKFNLMQMQNRRLRDENHEVKNNLDRIQGRIAVIETTSRKLAEVSGLSRPGDVSSNIGAGGPAGGHPDDLEQATAALERELRQIKDVVDRNQMKLSSTPSGWPVRGYVSDGFGTRSDPFSGGAEVHAGLDIATTFGTAIEATADGIVIFAGSHAGYGNVVVIDHGYGVTTRYGHMSRIDAKVGDRVTRGRQIGAVGSTGRSTGPHCHYEVRIHDRPVNPLNYISIGRS